MTDPIDIVDELRAAAVGWRTPIFHQAAAEIERLRGQVDSMQMANDMLRATHKTDNQYLLDEIERLVRRRSQEDRDRVRRKLNELDKLRQERDELAAEIERLRGEGDWEYGVSWDSVEGRVFMPTESEWRAGVEVRRMSTGDPYPEENYVVRRRKAGPWERVEGEGDA